MIVTPKDIEDRIQTDLNIMIELFRSGKLEEKRALCGIAGIVSLRSLKAELERKQKTLETLN